MPILKLLEKAMKITSIVALLVLSSALAGCISRRAERGIEPRWHDSASKFERGLTTREDMLAALGPPSQILSLDSETAYYYLLENTETKGLILLVYNQQRERTTYDRAVFFFDAGGVLTDFAVGNDEESADE
jgi:outer membrane protein assembly factor BamE (lipoprotein component of BamABCDE complex)